MIEIQELAMDKLVKGIAAFFDNYLPLSCPCCGERYAISRNKLGICDGCFVEEILQRALYTHEEKGETFDSFIYWLTDKYAEDTS